MPTINNKHPNKEFFKAARKRIRLMEETNKKYPKFFDTEKVKNIIKKLWGKNANSK